MVLLDGPRAPSLANNFCGCKSRKQQTQLRTPGARSPGTASRCPEPYEKELGSHTGEHSPYLGDCTAYLLFFQTMLLQQDLFILQRPRFLGSTSPPDPLSFKHCSVSSLPSWAPRVPLPGSLPGLPSLCFVGPQAFTSVPPTYLLTRRTESLFLLLLLLFLFFI